MFQLFRRKGVDIADFEDQLNALALQIAKLNSQLNQLARLKRSVSRNVAVYAVTVYVLIVAYLVMQMPRNTTSMGLARFFVAHQLPRLLLLVFGFPAVVLAVHYVIQILLDYLVASKRNTRKKLTKKQRDKIEDLKKLTNYNTTNQLLDKYGDRTSKSASKSVPQPPKSAAQAAKAPQKSPATAPQRKSTPVPQTPVAAAARTPTKPSLSDRLLDLIVGSDQNESIENRYALICHKCFNHCGLAPPGTKDLEKVKFICPFCQFFNGDSELGLVPGEAALAVRPVVGQSGDVSEPETVEAESEVLRVAEGDEASKVQELKKTVEEIEKRQNTDDQKYEPESTNT